MPLKTTGGGTRAAARPRQMPLAIAAAPLVFVTAATLTLGAASAFARQDHAAREATLRAAFHGTGTAAAPPPEALRAIRRAQEEAAAGAAAAYAAQYEMRSYQQQQRRQARAAAATPVGNPAAQRPVHTDDWRWAGI